MRVLTPKEADRAARVLAAVGDDTLRQAEIRARAAMDTSSCRLAIRHLVARGRLEVLRHPRGSGGGSGAPAFVYRRVVCQAVAS